MSTALGDGAVGWRFLRFGPKVVPVDLDRRRRFFGRHRPKKSSRPLTLLLVVHRCITDLLAFGVGSTNSDSAGLAVGRNDDLTRGDNLAVFLIG